MVGRQLLEGKIRTSNCVCRPMQEEEVKWKGSGVHGGSSVQACREKIR